MSAHEHGRSRPPLRTEQRLNAQRRSVSLDIIGAAIIALLIAAVFAGCLSIVAGPP